MAQVREWEASGDPCWLFLDSVDEAKRADFALFDILTDVGDLSRFAVKVVAEAAKRRSAPDSPPTEG